MNLKTKANRLRAVAHVRLTLSVQRGIVRSIAQASANQSDGEKRLIAIGQQLDDAIHELQSIGEKDL